MNWFWINTLLGMAFFAAWVGIPLWLTFRHPDARPAQTAQTSQTSQTAAVAAPQADHDRIPSPSPELVSAG